MVGDEELEQPVEREVMIAELLGGEFSVIRIQSADRIGFSQVRVRDVQGTEVDLLDWIWQVAESHPGYETACYLRRAQSGQIGLSSLAVGTKDEVPLKYEEIPGTSLVGDFHTQPEEVDPGLVPDIAQLVSGDKWPFNRKKKFVRLVALGDRALIVLVKTQQPITEERELGLEEILEGLDREEKKTLTQDEYLEIYAAVAQAVGIQMFILGRGSSTAFRVSPALPQMPPGLVLGSSDLSFLNGPGQPEE